MDRCALFVDAGYALADGAMAVHGTRRRDSVSWDHAGLLKLLAGLARDRTGLPVLRCYWYEIAEGRRTAEHDALAEMPGLKLRLVNTRPGRREGIESQLQRDLVTLAKSGAISDAFIASADEHLAEIVAEVQDLGLRVVILHIASDGGWTIPAPTRQECDDIVEISGVHLRPFVELIRGAEPAMADEHYASTSYGSHGMADGNGSMAGASMAGALTNRGLPAAALSAGSAAYPVQAGSDYHSGAQPYGSAALMPAASAMPYQGGSSAAQHRGQSEQLGSPQHQVMAPEVVSRGGGGQHESASSAAVGLPQGNSPHNGVAPGSYPVASADGGAPVQSPASPSAYQNGTAHNGVVLGSSSHAGTAANGATTNGSGQHGPGQHVPGQHVPGQQGSDQHGPGQHGPGQHGPGQHGPGQQAPAQNLLGQSGYQNGGVQNGTAAQIGALQNDMPQNGVAQNGGPHNGAMSGGYQNGPQNGGPQNGYQNGVILNGAVVPGYQGMAGQNNAAPGGYQGGTGQSGAGPVGYQGGAGQNGVVAPGYQSGPGQSGSGPSGYQGGAGQSGAAAGGYQSPDQRGGVPVAASAGFEAAPTHSQQQQQQHYGAPDPGFFPGQVVQAGQEQHGRPGFAPYPVPGTGAAYQSQPQAQYAAVPAPVAQPQNVAQPQPVAQLPAIRATQAVAISLPDAVKAAHSEGFTFGESVGRDAPGLWLEAVLARKPRMPSDLEARLLQGSVLPIDSLLHDEVRHSLRRGFWDALESVRR